MQNHDKLQRVLIVIVILNIVVLVLVVMLSNFTYAQCYTTTQSFKFYDCSRRIRLIKSVL